MEKKEIQEWREELKEILKDETDMERDMIPEYSRSYAEIVLGDFISQLLSERTFSKEELKRILEIIEFIETYYTSKWWQDGDKELKDKLSKLLKKEE